jgi:hypothetical protein
MTVSKFANRMVTSIVIVASLAAAIVAAYRRDTLVVDGFFRIGRGAAANPQLQCRPTLRVVNVAEEDVLNLREEPSSQARIRLGIAPGSRNLIDLGEQKGAWRRIEFLGQVGFVHGSFVAHDAAICVPKPDAPRIAIGATSGAL